MDIELFLTSSMADNIHIISFTLLLLAGFNLPISEDIVFLVSASIAAKYVPDNTALIFAGCFLGAYISDIMAYCIGRYGFKKLLNINFFNTPKNRCRIEKAAIYFKKYGGKTLFFGRFFPFGVRNIIFLTAGTVHFRFLSFLIIDITALSITSSILFYTGYMFGENLDKIKAYIQNYKYIALVIILLALFYFVIRHLMKNKKF